MKTTLHENAVIKALLIGANRTAPMPAPQTVIPVAKALNLKIIVNNWQ